MTPIPILFTSWYAGLGGGETETLLLAQHLDPAEFTPHLLVPENGQLAQKWAALGYPVHLRRFRGATTYFIPAIWKRLRLAGAISELIAQHDIRLIHAEYHTVAMAAGAAQRHNIPILWSNQGSWFHPHWWQKGFFRELDLAVARSQAVQDEFLGNPPFMPRERMPVIPNTVDTARFHPAVDGSAIRVETNIPPDAPLVVMIARFQRIKGHHIFQEMIRHIAQKMPEARFLVAGGEVFGVAKDQQYRDAILQEARDDPVLAERLQYLGFRDDVERLCAAADVLVCPSEFESFGKVNIEAMATGTPAVSTNVGGPAETILDGITGFLVSPNDPAALADRVLRLLQDHDLRAQFGSAAVQHVAKNYSSDAMVQEYRTIFRRLLSLDV